MKAHPIWRKTHTKNLALLHAIYKVFQTGKRSTPYLVCIARCFFYSVQYLLSDLILNAASKFLCSEHLQSEVLQGDSKDYEAKQTQAYNDSTHLYTWSEVFLNHVEQIVAILDTLQHFCQTFRESLNFPT